MMKYIFTLLLGLSAISLSAQSEPVDFSKKSEIKLNTLYLLLGGLEVDYEHLINEESSFGVSLTYFFDDDVNYNWGITPHYRLFFGNQPALGFFVEGHGSVYGFENYDDFIVDQNGNFTRVPGANVTKVGMGIAVGGKFKSKRDVVVEVVAGLGRIFNDTTNEVAYPRLGISIGKRF